MLPSLPFIFLLVVHLGFSIKYNYSLVSKSKMSLLVVPSSTNPLAQGPFNVFEAAFRRQSTELSDQFHYPIRLALLVEHRFKLFLQINGLDI